MPHIPVLHPYAENVAVVSYVEEGLPRAFLHLARQHAEAVEAHLVGLLADLMALEQ
jgi:hypothetical protein